MDKKTDVRDPDEKVVEIEMETVKKHFSKSSI